MSQLHAKIAPSILSSDFARLGEETKRMLDLGADVVHVDVMDGAFVPNLTLGAPIVKCLRKYLGNGPFLDCHLMVAHPGQWVADFQKAGASSLTVHVEAFGTRSVECALFQADFEAYLKKLMIELGMRSAVAVKPKTPIDSVFPFADAGLVDMILVMTVEPGFGGQSFMEDMMTKVKEARTKYPKMDIQVDGGLAPNTIEVAAQNGANVIVAGTSVYGAEDPEKVMNMMRNVVKSHLEE